MSTANITVNGIKVPLTKTTTIFDIIEKFFRSRCEFIIKLNSEMIQTNKVKEIFLSDSDDLQIVAYSKHCYQAQKRTVVKDNEKEETK
jgi:sulfur carrier protein ThiS